MSESVICLMRRKPEVWLDNQNRLATLKGAPLHLFAMVVMRVLYERSLETEELEKAFYSYKPDSPTSNVLDGYMSEIYKTLLVPGKRDKEVLKAYIEQASLDLRDWNRLVQRASTDPVEVERDLAEGIQLYQGGLLPMWKFAWLQSEQERLQREYLRFWARSARILRNAGREHELVTMIDRALEFNVDPQSETHEELTKLRAIEGGKLPKKKKKGNKPFFSFRDIRDCDEVNFAKKITQHIS